MLRHGGHAHTSITGLYLVAAAAVTWSFGGAIARFLETPDSWAIVFWRSFFATGFLVLFMLVRHGPRGTVGAFRTMGFAGLGVALCFAVASTSFVVALSYTTVANILLMQAGAPLVAALLAFALFGERVSAATWIAIAAVIFGVGVMVSQSLSGKVSLVGDGLAIVIMFAFSSATVITRRHANVEMVPAVCLGTALAGMFSLLMVTQLHVSALDFFWLVLFGALNLGFGLAIFVTGARLVPAALAALVSTLEPVLAPLWVWLIHNETPTAMTLAGGGIVFAALLGHILMQLVRRQQGKYA